MAIGVYPGSFNPPTVAHLAIAKAAVDQCGLERVDLVLSRTALGKDDRDLVPIDDRLQILHAVAGTRDWLGAAVRAERLIADLAEGYDVVVLGADKWAQVLDPAWYDGDPAALDRVVARLPVVAFAPRAGHAPPEPVDGVRLVVLDVHPDHHDVSASAVRDGRHDWMLPEARAYAEATGAWGAARHA